MLIFDRYKNSRMPKLSRSTPELMGEERQMRIDIKNRLFSLLRGGAQLAAVNVAALCIMHYGVGWVSPHYGPVLDMVAPCVSAGYSVHIVASIGLTLVSFYPVGVAHTALACELTKRAPLPEARPDPMDDIR